MCLHVEYTCKFACLGIVDVCIYDCSFVCIWMSMYYAYQVRALVWTGRPGGPQVLGALALRAGHLIDKTDTNMYVCMYVCEGVR